MENGSELRLGMIGCGRIAQKRHLPILNRMRGVKLAAIADTDPETLSLVAERYQAPRCYDNHLALLQDDAIDAVMVCTPPASHYAHSRDVLESGRHLYVDSPLALSVQDCESLSALGERSGRVATVGMNLRYHSLVQRARQRIRSGLLGPVQAITATFSTPSRGKRGDVFPDWREPKTVDGSVFGESALQHFDTWRALTDADFSEISVQCSQVGGPVSITARMQHSENDSSLPIVVAAVFSEYSGDNSEIRLIGREGTISLSLYRYDGFSFCPALEPQGSVGQHLRALKESIRSIPQGVSNIRNGGEYAITFKRQLEAFVEACRGGEPPLVSIGDGKAAALASLAAFQSMTTGKSIEIQRG